MAERRVVITGLGALTPLGNDVVSTWSGLVAGRSGCGPITLFDASQFRTRFACEVKDFDILQLLDRKEARRMDRVHQFSVWVANEAMTDCGLELERENRDRIGVIWGTGMGGFQTICSDMKDYYEGDGTPRFSPFFIPMIIPNLCAGYVSIRYGLAGPSYAVGSACASSAQAIARAFDTIRLGRADVIVTGGAESPIAEGGVGGFNALRALSVRNDSPETASRPFSKSRDGFVIGEGAACLILEEKEHALARGAKIYAELVGVGESSDAYHITAPDPDGKGAMQAMKWALKDAGVAADQVDHINSHGTSTPLGDVAELKAIQQVFGEQAYRMNINATKSMTGHLLGAAGAVEAVATILALYHGVVPPTINHEEGDDDEQIDCRLNLTFCQAEKREMQYAMSNAFGFGGHNVSLLFKKY